jgi:hypothetical protein
MQLPVKKLKQDVVTRWNSTLSMLESLINNRWPISAVLSDTNVTNARCCHLDMKPEQWELAENLIKVLQPLQIATTFLSYEANVSCSCVLPMLFGLKQSLEPSEEHCSTISLFKCTVVAEIKRRWSLESLDPSSPLVLASALDPRFKQLKYLTNEARGVVKETIVSRMEKVTLDVIDESTDVTPAKKSKKQTAIDVLLGPEDEEESSNDTLVDELQGYLSVKPLPRDINPLDWWQSNQFNYPNLALVARSVFSIPATSTPAERIFSKAGLIVNHLRSSLKPNKVNTLVFLNNNLKALS